MPLTKPDKKMNRSSLFPSCVEKFLGCLLVAWGCIGATGISRAEDWPTYRANRSRSGYTPEAIPNQLVLRWTHRMAHVPRPAWPTSKRMQFDQVFQPIIVGDLVIMGSSVDDQVITIDANTGQVKWTFFTQGPVRFAPTQWRDRIFVTSDDGWLYALALESGDLLWSHRGGPDDRKVVGNDRVISHWPARGGPVVMDETVYFAAGIWPSDGVYLHALDAKTGKVQWSNGRTGELEMDQPHGGARSKSGVSAQGYLLADDHHLYVPTGRSVPAVFNRSNGEFLYYHLQRNQQRGGSRAVLCDSFLLNSGCLFDRQTGDLSSKLGLGPAVATPEGVILAEGKSLARYRWTDTQKRNRKGKRVPKRSLEKAGLVACEREILEFIITGNDAICGEDGRVCAIDYSRQKNTWWSHEVEGRALGLAFGNGRLIVSTDQGVLYCFDGEGKSDSQAKATKPVRGNQDPESSFPERSFPESSTLDFARIAKQILQQSRIKKGYCVDLDCGTGELALELARQSELQVYAIGSDPKRVSIARQRINKEGVYGSRVTVMHSKTDPTSLPRQFANLVVSSRSLDGTINEALQIEMKRLQRPFGGVVALGPPDAIKMDVSGELSGGGSWTHQNADAANTLCSKDQIVKGPLEMFWFRDVPFELPNRHGQPPAPLFHRGIMVVGGVDGLCALDAYNGHRVWTYELKGNLRGYDGIHHDVGVGETGSNFCIGDDSVYIRHGETCTQIDLFTGKVKAPFKTPVSDDALNRSWGYLAYRDGLLFGSVANQQHTVSPRYKRSKLYTESVLLFAIDPSTGKTKWKFQPKESIRNNAIAIGNDSVVLIDRPLVKADHFTNPRRGGKHPSLLRPDELPDAELVALDVTTGQPKWKQNKGVFGTQLSVSEPHGVILMNYQAVRHVFFKLPSEVGGRIAGFNLATGEPMWTATGDYKTRPFLRDSTVIAQGGAWDISTGETVPFEWQRSYGCGQISASANLMLFRSGTLGYWDQSRDAGTENYGGVRTSCWINAIPAGGLVLVPDGSAKCQCSYQMQAWFALREREESIR